MALNDNDGEVPLPNDYEIALYSGYGMGLPWFNNMMSVPPSSVSGLGGITQASQSASQPTKRIKQYENITGSNSQQPNSLDQSEDPSLLLISSNFDDERNRGLSTPSGRDDDIALPKDYRVEEHQVQSLVQEPNDSLANYTKVVNTPLVHDGNSVSENVEASAGLSQTLHSVDLADFNSGSPI